ncbi:MAG: hypothetical protein IJC37_07860 [Clostridia bacterium]|nr:hypothetical protein [Clostridia bacterium]
MTNNNSINEYRRVMNSIYLPEQSKKEIVESCAKKSTSRHIRPLKFIISVKRKSQPVEEVTFTK